MPHADASAAHREDPMRATTTPAPATASRSRTMLWTLTATHAANDFFTGAVAALLPFFVLQAGYSYAAVAGITLAATALSSVAQPVFGYLGDRFGLRWLSLAGLLVAGAGVAVSGLLADWYPAVLVAIALSGIGVAAYHPAATMEARAAGGGTSGAMSVFSVGGNVGVALAPAAVVLAVGWFGLPGTTLLFLPAVVLGAVYLVATRRSSRAARSAASSAISPARAPMTARDDWRSFVWLTVVLAMWSVAYVGTSAFVVLYSIDRFDASPEFASLALSLFPAAGAVGTLLGGWLADRIGRLRIVRIGYALAVLSILGIVLAPSAEIVIAATAALGFSLFLPFAPQITLSHSYLPNRIGVASGLTLGLTLSLGGLATPLLGVLADAGGIQLVFVAMAVLVAAGLGLSFVLAERASEHLPPQEPDAVAEAPVAAQ
ncbi:MFS transporter [Agromyces mediolanus]|uniref:MFS transporter n=2 Tax=Agromyces mediolanus TaxID=41986 RepID=A0A918CQ05_AGRME|nr:MFS transporter [Agromyces mediolanus]